MPKGDRVTFSETSPWPTGADPAPQLCKETERLVTLASYAVSELFGDDELARLARFAAHLCETPTGAVSLVEAERQIFLAREGMEATETPRSTSLCAHTMLKGEVLVVPDATKEARFADFTAVTSERNLRFYRRCRKRR